MRNELEKKVGSSDFKSFLFYLFIFWKQYHLESVGKTISAKNGKMRNGREKYI